MLKVYFESTPKDSNVIFENYEVTFDTEKEAIVVNAVLKEGVEKAPILALTAGDKNIVASCKGVQNEDGSYTFTLPVDAAVSVSGKWYDVRFFIDKAVYEVYMNSCMTNENYSAQYKVGSKTYQFQNWDGLLKIEFK